MESYVAVHRDAHGTERELTDHAEVLRAVQEPDGLTWIHFAGVTPEGVRIMEEDFGLHPLAIEDSVNEGYQRPKVDEYDNCTFLLVHGIDYQATRNVVTTTELNLFLGDRWVISSTIVDMPAVVHLLTEARTGRMPLPETPAVLVYTLVDAIVDNILPVVDRMEDVTTLIEEEVLANPNPALLDHLVNLKRSVMRLNRMSGPQAHLVGQIAQGTYPRLADTAVLFRDIHDHQVWVGEQIADLRERANHAVDMYHSALSIKQNETMRVLSIVASIFLPLTLLAGIYGMNFDYMPELGWEYGYFVVVGFMVVVVLAGTYVLFGHQLLGWGRDRIGNLVSFTLEPPVVSEAIREASRLRARVLRGRIPLPRPPRREGARDSTRDGIRDGDVTK